MIAHKTEISGKASSLRTLHPFFANNLAKAQVDKIQEEHLLMILMDQIGEILAIAIAIDIQDSKTESLL